MNGVGSRICLSSLASGFGSPPGGRTLYLSIRAGCCLHLFVRVIVVTCRMLSTFLLFRPTALGEVSASILKLNPRLLFAHSLTLTILVQCPVTARSSCASVLAGRSWISTSSRAEWGLSQITRPLQDGYFLHSWVLFAAFAVAAVPAGSSDGGEYWFGRAMLKSQCRREFYLGRFSSWYKKTKRGHSYWWWRGDALSRNMILSW